MKKLSMFLVAALMVTVSNGCGGSQLSDSEESVLRVCVSDLNSPLYVTVETLAKVYREEHPEVKIQFYSCESWY